MSNQSNKTIPKIKIKNNTIIPVSSDEDGFRSPRTPREKRNNSTPTQTQTFSTPNRFAALQNPSIFNFNPDSIEETETVTQNHNESINLDMSNVPPKKDQIPPISLPIKNSTTTNYANRLSILSEKTVFIANPPINTPKSKPTPLMAIVK